MVQPTRPASSGDLIVEADGRKIRSAYQAVDLILNRQPGETLPLVVTHGGERKNVDVVLGDQAPAAPAGGGPQLKVRVVGRNRIEVEKHLGEVGLRGEAHGRPQSGRRAGDAPHSIERPSSVIARLQAR